MKKLAALTVLLAIAVPLALAAPSTADPDDEDFRRCGSGEFLFNDWIYIRLKAYRVGCTNARKAAETSVYEFSTEGVIDPPRHWDRCSHKKLGFQHWLGKCKRLKGSEPQKITFLILAPPE